MFFFLRWKVWPHLNARHCAQLMREKIEWRQKDEKQKVNMFSIITDTRVRLSRQSVPPFKVDKYCLPNVARCELVDIQLDSMFWLYILFRFVWKLKETLCLSEESWKQLISTKALRMCKREMSQNGVIKCPHLWAENWKENDADLFVVTVVMRSADFRSKNKDKQEKNYVSSIDSHNGTSGIHVGCVLLQKHNPAFKCHSLLFAVC